MQISPIPRFSGWQTLCNQDKSGITYFPENLPEIERVLTSLQNDWSQESITITGAKRLPSQGFFANLLFSPKSPVANISVLVNQKPYVLTLQRKDEPYYQEIEIQDPVKQQTLLIQNAPQKPGLQENGSIKLAAMDTQHLFISQWEATDEQTEPRPQIFSDSIHLLKTILQKLHQAADTTSHSQNKP